MKLTSVFITASLRQCLADIPVHCHGGDVEGVWDLHLTPGQGERSSCGHAMPDKVTQQPLETLMGAKTTVTRSVELQGTPSDWPKSQGGRAAFPDHGNFTGTWRMVADEGFEVNLDADDLGLTSAKGPLSLFGFSRFDLPSSGDQKKAVSKCGETLLGWYSVGREQWGCWRGKKRIAAPVRTAVIKTTVMTKAKEGGAPLSLRQASERVRRINSRQSKWTAKVYDRWIGKTSAELETQRGLRWHKQHDKHHSFLALSGQKDNVTDQRVHDEALAKVDQRYYDGSAEAEKRLPTSVDWSLADDGVNYLEHVMDQGACGSCWATSGMRMITARHKIAQKAPDALPWSISFPLYCSEFNQGCEGGYGYLAAKWSQEVGLLPATCATYTDAGKKCSVNTTCLGELRQSGAKRWRTSGSRYVGGRQRAATEASMMEELHKNGPIVVGLSGEHIGDDFMFYAGGIYMGESEPPKDTSGGHAVALVGYGEEEGDNSTAPTKYWLVQNSWGSDWGEDGFVRMSREVIQFRTGEVADVVEDERNGAEVDRVGYGRY